MGDRVEKYFNNMEDLAPHDFNWKIFWIILVVALFILGISFWSAKARAGNDEEYEDNNEYVICHCQGEGQEIRCTTKPHLSRTSARRHLRNHEADYKGECRISPTSTPTPSPIEECKENCEPSVTPTPQQEDKHDNYECWMDNACIHEPSAPQGDVCVPALKDIPTSVVEADGIGKLKVKWWKTDDAQFVHIRYQEDGQTNWPYSLLATPNDGEEVIGGLKSGVHYWFSVAPVSREGWGACVGNWTKPFDPIVR